MLLFFNAFSFDSSDSIADKVRKAAADENAFAALSKEFEKHNRFIASRATGRFITENDDEWSVVLLAFYEAVREYRPDKGGFTAFSDLVIRRRIIDHIRYEKRSSKETAVDMDFQETDPADGMRVFTAAERIAAEAIENAGREREAQDIRWEIEGLNKELAGYGISFTDLPDASPKAEKTKKACAGAAAAVLGNRALYQKLRKNHRLPAKEISKSTGIPLKTLDKHRKYIIAVILIMAGDFPQMQTYTKGLRKLMESEEKQ